MTVRQHSSELIEPRSIVDVVDWDDYLGEPFCPLCSNSVAAEPGTPDVATHYLDEDLDVDELPVYGWRCDCRRHDVVLLAPEEHAPENFTPVDATIDGETTTVAAPAPPLEAARPDEE